MRRIASANSMNDPRAQLLYDAFGVLDKYSATLGNRDPVKSLNEDANELLQRVRVALELLMSRSPSHDEATDLTERIDAVLGAESKKPLHSPEGLPKWPTEDAQVPSLAT